MSTCHEALMMATRAWLMAADDAAAAGVDDD
jgi:hypothetical protein